MHYWAARALTVAASGPNKIVMIHLMMFCLGLAAADLPVEPVTYPKQIKIFETKLDASADAGGLKPLSLTTIQFDQVDRLLPDLRMNDADRGLNETIKSLVRSAVVELPRQSAVMKAVIDQPIVLDGSVGRRRLVGGVVVKVLTRSGVTPARDATDGARVAHVVIDRLGFELRWTPDFPVGKPPRRRAVVNVESNLVPIVRGRDLTELNLQPPAEVRARLVSALRDELDESSPERIDPRIYVHLLDRNDNNFGHYPLATALNEALIREATDRPAGWWRRCQEAFERKF